MRAIQTLISGKRNNLEDLGIVEQRCSRPLGPHDRKLDPLASLSPTLSQDTLDAAKDQFLGGTALARRSALQAPINRVRDVNCSSHGAILPYLWSAQKQKEQMLDFDRPSRVHQENAQNAQTAGNRSGIIPLPGVSRLFGGASALVLVQASSCRFNIFDLLAVVAAPRPRSAGAQARLGGPWPSLDRHKSFTMRSYEKMRL